MATIGFIGLGNMGAPMAANLLTAGHQVIGYDVVASAGAALAQKGGRAAASAPEAAAARDAGIDNLVTADDLARLMVALAEGRLAGPAAAAACERTLRGQSYRDGIPAGLPGDLDVGNKTGWIDDHTHDMAIVRPDGAEPFALVVLSRLAGVPTEVGIARIAELARRAWGRRG